MSLIYSTLYLMTNVIVPIGCLIYSELRDFSISESATNSPSQITGPNQIQTTGNLISEQKHPTQHLNNTNYRCDFGKWALFALSMLLFSLLTAIFPKSLLIIFSGLILKLSTIHSPKSLTRSVQNIIQKLHFEVYLSMINTTAIELYLDLTQKINFFIIFYTHKQRQQQLNIFSRMKDNVSRIQLELQDNQNLKNKSFIVAKKKMHSMPSKIKSFQNIGVNCDILKSSSDVGKQILKILSEKIPVKQPSQNNLNSSKIEQPTKDNFPHQNRPQKSAIYPARSQSLQEKVLKMKSSMNVPTSEKKRVNQVKIKDTPFMIKRSQTDIGQQFDSQQDSPKRTRQNHHITWNNRKTEKAQQNLPQRRTQYSNETTSQDNNSSSVMTNMQNVGILDIIANEVNQSRKNSAQRDSGGLGRILQADQGLRENQIYMNSVVMTEEPTSPKIIPTGINISSINQHAIHPFKLNISSLSNPLVLSNTISNTNILPKSVVTSTQHQIISQIQRQPSSNISQNPVHKTQLSNISYANTINVGQRFSEESSIPNKLQMSINESDYSDMFESEEEQEPKLEIKVEAIIENPRDNGLKPRMEICYIELYDNDEMRFMSMHDKLVSKGKLIKMYKKPDNYYELVIVQQTDKKQGSSEIKEQKAQQVIKRIKFRGQARPFMKYLQSVKPQQIA